MCVGAVGLQAYDVRIPEGLRSALRTESRSRRSRVLMMSTEGKGITCVSMPVCATDRRVATSCAREDGATADFFSRCASERARPGTGERAAGGPTRPGETCRTRAAARPVATIESFCSPKMPSALLLLMSTPSRGSQRCGAARAPPLLPPLRSHSGPPPSLRGGLSASGGELSQPAFQRDLRATARASSAGPCTAADFPNPLW